MNFESILKSTTELSVGSCLLCMISALIFGIIIALTHTINKKYSRNFVITLAILPLLVQVVIMLVNGNLGTSVAIMGAFTLIRFRSMPGTSRELVSVFFAMAVGLAVGMGQIMYAGCFTIFTSVAIILLDKLNFGNKKGEIRKLLITIPENLDYTNIFDDVFEEYASYHEIVSVRTTNLGSMYKINYDVQLKDSTTEKAFLDKLRVRNGNLDIVFGREENNNEL